ncbi:putative sensor histidine kinase/response regulator [Vibrio nigripulchritudo MADA3029]|uniref:ATP-binding protein n=1 Tax=Vibrio nigripulchritudo TaxID=28173 RepID=UPI0003B2012D|nr:ATP-binding protein [Vibrio nigripulchritudo]CCN45208.1 putative sensor histidine kinase/response regulator [Vibrio nigripulchritudo MADA3020]CCN53967.1 putative sensor histidine kinase/response regulator [Vibrio nigripulchritudo MADA3021]CCN57596.1 putative sensor histidine kinase/response regulator [Vibrio nigripulchritudo MADA3029]
MFKSNKKQKFKRLQHTLMVAFLVLSITPLTLIALFFLQSHSKDLQEQSTSHLLSVRDTKKQQLVDYFDAKESEVMGFVRSELAYNSGGRFYGLINAFSNLGETIEQSREYAQQRYIEGSGDQIKTSILPESDDYQGSERYRLMHKRYHRRYVDLLKRSDFDDILLVDLDGNVVYSLNKHDNYGTNLGSGKYRDSNLGETFQAIKSLVKKQKDTPNITPIVMSDFALEGSEHIAWFAAPIIQQEYLHSYALFRLPSTKLISLFEDTAARKAIKAFLVGSDKQARVFNVTQEEIDKSSEIIDRALNGQTSVRTFINTAGESIIAAYTSIKIQNIEWALIAERTEAEAFARIQQLEKVFVVAMLIAIILVVICSHYLSNFITSPLLKLTWSAERVSAGDLDEVMFETRRKDEIGRLAVSFQRMQRSIREKILTIKSQNEELEAHLKVIQSQNDELQLANKLKDEFLATTSHELRTPLHGMVGIAEALISGANGPIPANQKHQLDIIINSGQRLATLVDDLLDYHKMRYGSLDIQAAAVNLSSSTRLVLELSQHLLGNKSIRIINQVPMDLPLVSADPQRLEQVLYNLIGNAIKYTSEGKIVISATVLDDKLRVQVVDTGQGIPAEQLEHIFEPLIQAGQDSSRYRQGAGLGLSISRQLIELMGGTLYVSSQPLVGTTFSFSLPLASDAEISTSKQLGEQNHFQLPEANENSSPEDNSLPENPEGPLIVVADDEPVNLQILDSFLRMEGYRVKTAKDGTETLELVQLEKPELLLLDVMMPGLSGYQVCEQVRLSYDLSELPVIMLTALSQTNDRIKGFDSGANDYLTKPFNKLELASRIKAHLSASKAELRRIENDKLQAELKQRALVEANLLETQGRLLEQLESAPEAILCLRDDGRIRFANEAASKLFKRTQEQLKRSNGDEVIAPKYLNLSQEHFCGGIDVYIDDRREHLSADVLKLPEGSDIQYMYIFNVGGGINATRINNLETAVEALSSYAFEGDKDKLQQLKELGGEFTRIADKVSGRGGDKTELMREILVDSMTTAIDYWESETGQTKFSFAEQSGLWRVYLDRSTLQTRTLDKYLRVETLPKTPRWRTVLNSIEFILDNCHTPGAQRDKLVSLRDKLQKLLTS